MHAAHGWAATWVVVELEPGFAPDDCAKRSAHWYGSNLQNRDFLPLDRDSSLDCVLVLRHVPDLERDYGNHAKYLVT